MAELTGVPYSRIMLVAIFPAVMYIFSVFIMVHYEAKKYNIKGEKSEHSAMEILKTQWYYIMPLVMITILMLYGFSPGYSAILGIVTCIIISWFRTDTRITPKRFIEASRAGTENSLKIGATVGVIGIIIGVLTYSGLVLTFADIVIELGQRCCVFRHRLQAGGHHLSDCPGFPGPGNGGARDRCLPGHGGRCGAGPDTPGG